MFWVVAERLDYQSGLALHACRASFEWLLLARKWIIIGVAAYAEDPLISAVVTICPSVTLWLIVLKWNPFVMRADQTCIRSSTIAILSLQLLMVIQGSRTLSTSASHKLHSVWITTVVVLLAVQLFRLVRLVAAVFRKPTVRQIRPGASEPQLKVAISSVLTRRTQMAEFQEFYRTPLPPASTAGDRSTVLHEHLPEDTYVTTSPLVDASATQAHRHVRVKRLSNSAVL